MSFRLLLTAVLAAGLSSAGQAGTIYVDDDNCPGPGSGTEADPYCSIQIAIDNAVDTDEIVVAPGTYFETINFLGKAVWLHSSGGPEVTIIDAQGTGTVATCNSGEGPETRLDGFTITGGSAVTGGAMYVDHADPTVVDCAFVRNTDTGWGGGLMCSLGSPTVVACTFVRNEADKGGALGWANAGGVIEGCTFIGNVADFGGGGISAWQGVTLTDCVLAANEADVGGGIASTYGTTRLTACRLIGNTANAAGGALYISDGASEVVSCDVSYNVSPGGALHFGDSPARITESTIVGNLTNALYWDGGYPVNSALIGCIIWGITADPVGGITTPTVTYSDVEGGWTGPGENNIDADPQFVDDTSGTWTSGPTYDEEADVTILTDAAASYVPGELVGRRIVPDARLEPVQTVVLSNTETTITLLGELWSVIVTEGETYLIRDHRLSAASPCIDAGHNWAIEGLVDADLNGSRRFADGPAADTGCGLPVVVDMGAYEYQGDPFPVRLGDLDGDGAVGVTDFLLLLAGWGACTADCCLPDLDLDGDVGVADFLILLAQWG